MEDNRAGQDRSCGGSVNLRQYQPCEHRRQSGLMNVHYGDEPCPICQAEEARRPIYKALGFVLLVAALALTVWWLS